MARVAKDIELDQVAVPIPDDRDVSMDAWLASLLHGEPAEFSISGADLVADARDGAAQVDDARRRKGSHR